MLAGLGVEVWNPDPLVSDRGDVMGLKPGVKELRGGATEMTSASVLKKEAVQCTAVEAAAVNLRHGFVG